MNVLIAKLKLSFIKHFRKLRKSLSKVAQHKAFSNVNKMIVQVESRAPLMFDKLASVTPSTQFMNTPDKQYN